MKLLLLPIPLTLGALALLRPGLLTSGAGSPIALATGAGVGLAGLLVLAAFWRRSRVLSLAAADLVVLALLAAVVWPAFRERTVIESFPPVAEVLPVAATPPPVAVPTRASSVLISRGTLHGIGHRVSGHVAVYRIGSVLRLRFEGVSFQGTPSPSVHLVASGARSTRGGVTIGALKGEHGDFSYLLPKGSDPARVLVWCDRYDVPIATADLSDG